MANPLDLDEFVLSVPPDGLSLSVASYLFLADQFDPELDLMGVHKHLWLSLGLSAVCTSVDYDTDDGERPSICLEVDHPDKASSLLSPPGAVTTSIEGLVCHLDYRAIANGGRERPVDSVTQKNAGKVRHSHGTRSQTRSMSDRSRSNEDAGMEAEDSDGLPDTQDDIDDTIRRRRTCTAQLTVAALYRMIGVKPRFFGVQGITPIPPTLLDIAPAMWNAHYMQLIRHHSRQLPLIADIIENAGTWRGTLREKVADLCNDIDEEPPEDAGTDSIQQYNSLHGHLWTLLRSNMMNNFHIQSAARKAHDELEATADEFFSDDAFSLPPGDERDEILDYGFDDWEQDETQQATYWAMQSEHDLSDYEPADVEDNSGPASTGQTMHPSASAQEYIADGMENESAYPDSEGPYDDMVYDDINPGHLHVREHHPQLRHFSRNQEA
ncbi:hypothetical protein PG985_009182 [Apiospora marii]|uniref:uncharacterized protein n=1 Tax=Apiospora marii TaxID=335849 RepID=UPI003131F9F1